mgnify:CR=1 FL=1
MQNDFGRRIFLRLWASHQEYPDCVSSIDEAEIFLEGILNRFGGSEWNFTNECFNRSNKQELINIGYKYAISRKYKIC